MSDSPARRVVVPALLVALLAASAWIAVPLGSVPLTLQVFVVVLAALLLTPGQAAATMAVYLLLGAIGAPVFSGGRGGLGVLVGPTGGYLIGFLLAAVAGSLLRARLRRSRVTEVRADTAAGFVTLGIIYLVGWLQLALVTGTSLEEAFVAGVVPFVVLDVAKTVVAIGVASALRRSGVVHEELRASAS